MRNGWMYMLLCADGSYYTGSTNNLELRLQQHKNGEGANHTRKRLPVQLVYLEEYHRVADAFYREKQVQGWTRKKKEALIANMPEKLHNLAKCLNETSHENRGFDSAGFDSAQPPGVSVKSLPERSYFRTLSGTLSGVEGNTENFPLFQHTTLTSSDPPP